MSLPSNWAEWQTLRYAVEHPDFITVDEDGTIRVGTIELGVVETTNPPEGVSS